MREVVAKILARHGHQVECASNGKEALEKVRSHPPELIFTDLIMPDMEGLETITRLRRAHPTIPIIATSGGGRCGPQDYLQLAARFGAAKVLPKPFTGDELVTVVQSVLNSTAPVAPPTPSQNRV